MSCLTARQVETRTAKQIRHDHAAPTRHDQTPLDTKEFEAWT